MPSINLLLGLIKLLLLLLLLLLSTSPPDERTFLINKLEKLKELADSSQDMESDNIIKWYQRRPKQLEKFCLADFVAWFECVKDTENDTISIESSLTGSDDFLPEINFEENIDDNTNGTNVTDQQCEVNEYKLT